MGGLLQQKDGLKISVVMSEIFMRKLEQDTVVPINPLIYKRYVDDCFRRRKKGDESILQKLNQYHPNIKFTCVKIDSEKKFLDTNLIEMENGLYAFEVNCRKNKLLYKVPERYK